MIDVSKLKIGEKVHYVPFVGAPAELYENGMVKEIPDAEHVRVVYHCAGEWNRFADYTSALTNARDLRLGWYHGTADFNSQS